MKAKGNASADTARILRREMLSEQLAKSAQARAEAGIVTLNAQNKCATGVLVHPQQVREATLVDILEIGLRAVLDL